MRACDALVPRRFLAAALEGQFVRTGLQKVRVRILETNGSGAQDLDAALAILSEGELERFRNYHFARDRKDYALAHALLRRTLSDFAPETERGAWQFETRASGKPGVIARPDLDFSLTHARGLVACAVADTGLVGIDAETDERPLDMEPLFREVCSPGERQELATLTGLARTSRFFDFWTLKEAYLKARGVGITGDLSLTGFTIADDGNIRLEAARGQPGPDATFCIYRCSGPARVALATLGITGPHDIEVTKAAKWNA